MGPSFVVVPPWAQGYRLKDLRFVGYGTSDNLERLLNRFGGDQLDQPNNGAGAGASPIGEAAGFKVYRSNQVPNTSGLTYNIIAGHPMAWSFAQQILEVEAYRPQYRFSDALKGLNVYGAKVTRPNALALLIADPT